MTTSVSSEQDLSAQASRSYPLRIISGLGAIGLFLLSAVFTFGTSLAAPLGMFVSRRLATRNGRPFTGLRSWVSAAAASSIAVILLFAALLTLVSQEDWRQIQQAVVQAQAEQSSNPGWLSELPPPDPVTESIVRSTAFTAVFGMLGLIIACILLGVIAGTPGWLATVLASYAFRGRGAARHASEADAGASRQR